MRYAFILLSLLLTLVTTAKARLVETWSYERLFKEAAVVVIASAQETVDTTDQAKNDQWKARLVGQNTRFTVHAVLKGELADRSLTVLHFKLRDDVKDGGLITINGPMLVRFRARSPMIEGKGYSAKIGTPQYMLFLTPASNSRFAPVSGEVDPGLSVKEMYRPLAEVIPDEK